MVSENLVKDVVSEPYKYGFVTDIETEKISKGLNEEIIRLKKWQTLAIQNSRENKVLKKLLNATDNNQMETQQTNVPPGNEPQGLMTSPQNMETV